MEIALKYLALAFFCALVVLVPLNEWLRRYKAMMRRQRDRGLDDVLCGAAGIRFDLADLQFDDPPEVQYPSALDAECDAPDPAAFRMNRERRGSWPHDASRFGGNAHQRRVFRRFVERGCV